MQGEYFNGAHVYGDNVYISDYHMDEKWARIRGSSNYMVSDKGRVWSDKSQCFLQVKSMDDHGHLGVCLYENGNVRYEYIHRLVAEAFIPNPNNYPIVRHIVDDPSQNTSDDLEWGTQRDNLRDAARNGRFYNLTDEDRERSYEKSRTPIKAIDRVTGEECIYRSQADAGRALGIPQANIYKVASGERRSAGGYTFEYAERGSA